MKRYKGFIDWYNPLTDEGALVGVNGELIAIAPDALPQSFKNETGLSGTEIEYTLYISASDIIVDRVYSP